MPGEGGFFEMRERVTARPRGAAIPPAGSDPPLTPAALNRLVDQALKRGLPASFVVRGEISNFNRNRSSGHVYFTLKDAAACVDCVMFASRADSLKFEPQDGMEVCVTGAIGVYAPRGRYQVYANRIDPVGEGALELAKRQLETRLRAEGLLDLARKRPIPSYPHSIAVITSPQAAGFADMLKVLRRFRFLRLLIFPVPVQGNHAAAAIAYALRCLGTRCSDVGGVDVIVLGRGGGSLEDLWPFNEEMVARAIAACAIPVVTGIGHEVDVSIADLVADYHAHTPTEAATVVTRHWRNAVDVIDQSRSRLGVLVRSRVHQSRLELQSIQRHELFRKPASLLDQSRQRIDDLESRLLDHAQSALAAQRDRLHEGATRLAAHRPTLRLQMLDQRLGDLRLRLARAGRSKIDAQRRGLTATESLLRALAPQNVLKRGYSITTHSRTGQVIHSAAELARGDVILTRLAEGEIRSTVEDSRQGLLFDNVPKK